ncbi:hypothetical protein J1F00_06110 [Stenotrophomonas maltophilia]|nr:hypothetical protein [Stenotrophomonas maltophilia]
MTTDNKTLADVQPGGRVRLGDALPPLPKMEHIGRVVGMGPHDTWYEPVAYTAEQMRDYARAALSARPSPGGQGDLKSRFTEWVKANGYNPATFASGRFMGDGVQIAWKAVQALAAPQPAGEPVCSGGFVISNGSGEKYMAWGQVGPEWTADRSAALWLVRRADAEALAAENEDAWSILPVERCALPPNGWACTLAAGHEGPCPAIAAPPAQALDLERFRGTVKSQYSMTEWMHRSGFVSAEKLEESKKNHDHLMALIDSQAVGNG